MFSLQRDCKMSMYKVNLALLFAICILSETTALGIGNIFGAKRDSGSGKSDLQSDELSKEESKQHHEHHDHHDHHHRPPLLPAIPHPSEHPLHHENNPNHPLNLITSVVHHHRPTIIATKTVYVEVTKKVTEHPICIEVHGVKPPCIQEQPFTDQFINGPGYIQEQDNIQNGLIRPLGWHHQGYENGYFREGGLPLDEGKVQIKPTATVEVLEPTRILGGVSESAPAPSIYEEEIGEEEARSGRYLKIHSKTPSAPLKEIAESEINESPEIDDSAEIPSEGRLILARQPEYHYATKTLWVTKVQKFIDHKVTATLIAHNCIPTNLRLPVCHKPPVKPVHKPVHEASYHHGAVGIGGGLGEGLGGGSTGLNSISGGPSDGIFTTIKRHDDNVHGQSVHGPESHVTHVASSITGVSSDWSAEQKSASDDEKIQ